MVGALVIGMGASESVPQVVDLAVDPDEADGLQGAEQKSDAAADRDLAAAAAAALGISVDAMAQPEGTAATKHVLGAAISEYKLEPTLLGEGGFGKVRLATNATTGHKVAVKIIKRNRLQARAEELLTREVKHHEV